MALNKNVIVISHLSNEEETYKNVIKRFKDYATKCKADFVQLQDKEDKSDAHFKTSELNSLSKKYQRILYFDSGVLVRKDSPNIFELVPQDQFAAYNEVGMHQLQDHFISQPLTERYARIQNLYTTCKLEPVELPTVFSFKNGFSYFNTGVALYNKKNIAAYQEITEEQWKAIDESDFSDEQTLTNYFIIKKNFKMFYLPVAFNQMPHNLYTDYLKTSYFIHYASLDSKTRIEKTLVDHAEWAKNKL